MRTIRGSSDAIIPEQEYQAEAWQKIRETEAALITAAYNMEEVIKGFEEDAKNISLKRRMIDDYVRDTAEMMEDANGMIQRADFEGVTMAVARLLEVSKRMRKASLDLKEVLERILRITGSTSDIRHAIVSGKNERYRMGWYCNSKRNEIGEAGKHEGKQHEN